MVGTFEADHPWDVSPTEAIKIQRALAERVVPEDRLGPVRYVAGVDVGFEEDNRVTRAAVAVLALPSLTLHAHAIARRPTSFPYIPGLLSFREVPAVLDALGQLEALPDLLLCDGQGTAHPRRFGIACHLGLITGIPSIGVAKSRLVGQHAPLAPEKGAWQPLRDRGEQVGAALRSRTGTKPLYVSPGHLISLPTALEWVLTVTLRWRLPETTRQAHRLASGAAPGR